MEGRLETETGTIHLQKFEPETVKVQLDNCIKMSCRMIQEMNKFDESTLSAIHVCENSKTFVGRKLKGWWCKYAR